jgi:hypothetical protein
MHTAEAVTVLHGVGLMLESRSAWGGSTQVFYDQEEVADVLIVEVGVDTPTAKPTTHSQCGHARRQLPK